MATLYDILPAATRAKYRLDALTPEAVSLLRTEVPPGSPPDKLALIVSKIDSAVPQMTMRARIGRINARHPDPTPRATSLRSKRPGWMNLAERGVDAAARALPSGQPIPESPNVPPPSTVGEHAVELAGGIAGFAGTTATLAPVLGPFAVGAAGAAPHGTLKQRAIRGATTQAASAAAGAVSKKIATAAGGTQTLLNNVVTRFLGKRAVSAGAFGAAQPVAEVGIERLTGEDVPAPTPWDLAAGSGKLLAAEIIMGGVAAGRRRALRSRQPAAQASAAAPPSAPETPVLASQPSPEAAPIPMPAGRMPAVDRYPGALAKLAPRLAGDRRLVAGDLTVADAFRSAVERAMGGAENPTRADVKAAVRKVVSSGVMDEITSIADAVAVPRGIPSDVVARETRFADELSRRAAGRTVDLQTPSGPLTTSIVRVVTFRSPGVPDPVRVIVMDPETAKMSVVRYGSVADFVQSVGAPKAMVKAEGVFERAERDRARRAAPPPAVPVPAAGPQKKSATGTSPSAPAATAPREPVAPVVPQPAKAVAPVKGPAVVESPAEPPAGGPVSGAPPAVLIESTETPSRKNAEAIARTIAKQRPWLNPRVVEKKGVRGKAPTFTVEIDDVPEPKPAATPKPAEPAKPATPKPAEPAKPAAPKPAEPAKPAAPKPEPKPAATPKPASASLREIAEVDSPVSVEERKAMKSGVHGKSLHEAARWVEEAVPDEALRAIAGRVRVTLEQMVAAGSEVGVAKVVDKSTRRVLASARSQRVGFPDISRDRSVSVYRGGGVRALLHELVHSATSAVINSYQRGGLVGEANAAARDAITRLEILRVRVLPHASKIEGSPTRQAYSLKNLDEFLAAGLTDSRVQRWLDTIQVGKQTAWTQFVGAVRKALGLPAEAQTALSEFLRQSERLLARREAAGEPEGPPVEATPPPAPRAPAATREPLRVEVASRADGKNTFRVLDTRTGKPASGLRFKTRALAEAHAKSLLAAEARAEARSASKENPPEFEKAASAWKPGAQVVSFPNTGRGNAARRRGVFQGYSHTETIIDPKTGEVRDVHFARVDARHGKSVKPETHPVESLRKISTFSERTAASRAVEKSLREQVAKRVGDSYDRAVAEVAKYEEKVSAANDALLEMGPRSGLSGADRQRYDALSRAARAADRALAAAREVRDDLSGKPNARTDAFDYGRLSPEYRKPLLDEKMDDLPPESLHDYRNAVLRGHVGSPAEAREALRFAKSYDPDDPGSALRAEYADALSRGFRAMAYSEHYKTSPEAAKADPAHAAAVERAAEFMRSARIEGVDPFEVQKRVDEILGARSPADDVPVGRLPEPPADFSTTITDHEIRAHSWLARLRRIPRDMAAAARNVPARDRKLRIVDARGNVRHAEDHGIYEPDYRAQSAATRGIPVALRPGRDVLPPDLMIEYANSQARVVEELGRGTNAWTEALGDAKRRVLSYTGISRDVMRVAEEGVARERTLKHLARKEVRAIDERIAALQRPRKSPAAEAARVAKVADLKKQRAKAEQRIAKLDAEIAARVGKNLPGLPPEVAHVPAAVRALYEKWLERYNAERVANGKDPLEGIEGYAGPHERMGQVSAQVENAVSRLLGHGGRSTPQSRDMTNRFLLERTGDIDYIEDAARVYVDYAHFMANAIGRMRFIERTARWVDEHRGSERSPRDSERAEEVAQWVLQTMFRAKGPGERAMDMHHRLLAFAKGTPKIEEESIDFATRFMRDVDGQPLTAAAIRRQGWKRVFVVPKSAAFTVGNQSTAIEVGQIPGSGQRVFVTKGAHLFADQSGVRLKAPLEALGKARVKLSVERDAILERLNNALGGKGDFLSEHFTKDEHYQRRYAEWRDAVLRSEGSFMDSIFRSMGDMQSRGLLGYNVSSALRNSLQVWMTLAPRVGYRRTAVAVGNVVVGSAVRGSARAAVRRGWMSRRAYKALAKAFPDVIGEARALGVLQGEVQRVGEMYPGEQSALKRALDILGPMTPFRMAEDFSRGVAMLAAEYKALDMGYDAPTRLKIRNAHSEAFFEEVATKRRRMLEPRASERFQVFNDAETMYRYDPLGQAAIQGAGVLKLLMRFTTFPLSAVRQHGTNLAGGSAKVAWAGGRGVLDKLAGGRLGKPSATPAPNDYGTYPEPKNRLGKFLDEYGARYYDRANAATAIRMFARVGVGLALSSVGVNAAVLGFVGWEALPLMIARFLLPDSDRRQKALQDAAETIWNASVVNPRHPVEGVMSPVLRNVWQMLAEDFPQAYKRFVRELDNGKKAAAAAAAAEPATSLVHRQAVQSIPGYAAAKRYLQNLPGAARAVRTKAGKAIANALDIRSVYRTTPGPDFYRAILGLRPESEMAKKRVPVNKPTPRGVRKPKGPKRPRRAVAFGGASIYREALA